MSVFVGPSGTPGSHGASRTKRWKGTPHLCYSWSCLSSCLYWVSRSVLRIDPSANLGLPNQFKLTLNIVLIPYCLHQNQPWLVFDTNCRENWFYAQVILSQDHALKEGTSSPAVKTSLLSFNLQGEQGDDGKIEGPPGPPGDIVSHSWLTFLPASTLGLL